MGRKKGDKRWDYQPQIPPGGNSQMIRDMLAITELGRCDFTDLEDVEDHIKHYLRLCDERDIRISVEGLALGLGIGRTYLWEIVTGQIKHIPQDVVNTIKTVYEMMNFAMSQNLQNGQINPAAGIFLLKNNAGYRDIVEQVQVKRDPYEDGDPQEIARRYLAGASGPALDVGSTGRDPAPAEIAPEELREDPEE